MMKIYKLNARKTGIGLIIFIIFNAISICFLHDPDRFIRNFLMRKLHIQILGYLLFLYSAAMIYSFSILLFFRREALIITSNHLIDSSRYESIGKISFTEIQEIKRIKKNSIEIILKEGAYKSRRQNILKKLLRIMNTWKSQRNSVIISSALIEAEIDDIEKAISKAINNTIS